MPYLEKAHQVDLSHSVLNDIAGNYVVYKRHAFERRRTGCSRRLKPAVVERGGYDVPGCMDGTRKSVFAEISGWLNDLVAPNVLWISGSPGAGKSAVASSLVSELTKSRRLASHFFFNRDHAALSNPAVLWRTVASDLARFNPGVKASLLKFLKKADFRDSDISLHFHCLVVEPLLANIDYSSGAHPVVVLDALDECGSDEAQSSQRRILLDTLTSWSSSLPATCKLIVTTRDERVPFFFHDNQRCYHIVLETGDVVSRSTADDIRIFFEKSFAYITPELGLPAIWPGLPKLTQLTERAAGLFIWAKTTIAFIAENQGNPELKLQLILDGKLGKGREAIDNLYGQILRFAFKRANDATLELFRGVVGTIVVAKVPLHCDDLKHFLGKGGEEDNRQIGVILHKLSSLIRKGDDGLLHLRHLSFVEFLIDVERCHEPRFVIDLSKYRQGLALACLQLMNSELKFNIGGLETSHCCNKDMEQSIPIPTHLSYSCCFWAEHLVDEKHDRRPLMKEIQILFHVHFLFWLEVLSLIKEMSVAQLALLKAARWLEVSLFFCHHC